MNLNTFIRNRSIHGISHITKYFIVYLLLFLITNTACKENPKRLEFILSEECLLLLLECSYLYSYVLVFVFFKYFFILLLAKSSKYTDTSFLPLGRKKCGMTLSEGSFAISSFSICLISSSYSSCSVLEFGDFPPPFFSTEASRASFHFVFGFPFYSLIFIHFSNV